MPSPAHQYVINMVVSFPIRRGPGVLLLECFAPNSQSFSCGKLYYANTIFFIYRVSQEECARLREGVPYVKVYLYNPKHLCPKWNGYGDNGQ